MSNKAKAAIVLDNWKLKTYRKVLRKAKYKWINAGPFSPGTTVLKVLVEPTDEGIAELHKVLVTAEEECKEQTREDILKN